MRILNVYSHDNHQLARYVNMLCSEMPSSIDMKSVDDSLDMKKTLENIHPDIIHIHGSIKWNITNDFRIVISPHGENINRDAYVVIARSEMERKKLSETYERLEVVRNPFLTKTTTNDACCNQLEAIYRKVIDSDVFPLMDSNTIQMMHAMLKAGITGDARWVQLEEFHPVDWHKLHIHAHYQGISDIIRFGATVLDLQEPTSQVINSYLPSHYNEPIPLERHDATSIITKIIEGDVALLRFVELDIALRRGDIDEESFLHDLKELHFDTYLPSILQILKETTWLDEGFMPCLPQNNKYTNKLRTLMANYLRI